MKSKTLIEKQVKRKTNLELIETIRVAKKNKAWFEIAGMLSSPRRKRISLNLNEIDAQIKNEIAVVPGKVLSQGEVTKKIKVVAFNFSEKAKEKLLKSKCEAVSIINEIKKNPSAKNIKILNAKSKDFMLSKLNKKLNLNK